MAYTKRMKTLPERLTTANPSAADEPNGSVALGLPDRTGGDPLRKGRTEKKGVAHDVTHR